jgi:hypothetical protein
MKARGLLGVLKAWGQSLSIVILAVALLVAPEIASGATGKAAGIKFGSFEVGASNGYTVEVSSFKEDGSPGIAAVSAENGPLRATYEVRTDAPPGIHATFGVLGQLDFSFKRQAKAVERPEDGCRWISERGVFRGTLRFVGEGGYFSVESHDPSGEMLRLPDGFCGFNDRRARPFLGLESRTLEAQTSVEGRELSFRASKEKFIRRLSTFSASLRERVDGMNILPQRQHPRPGGRLLQRWNVARQRPPASAVHRQRELPRPGQGAGDLDRLPLRHLPRRPGNRVGRQRLRRRALPPATDPAAVPEEAAGYSSAASERALRQRLPLPALGACQAFLAEVAGELVQLGRFDAVGRNP